MKTKEIDERFDKEFPNCEAEFCGCYEGDLSDKWIKGRKKLIKFISTLCQSVLEEVREKIGEKFLPMDCEDDCDGGENMQGCGCHNDSFNSGLAIARNQVTSLINNLIEEK